MTQELQHEREESLKGFKPGNGFIDAKSFGVGNAMRVYRKLQTGDNRSATISIPLSWSKNWSDSKLCGYVRLTKLSDSSILLEGV